MTEDLLKLAVQASLQAGIAIMEIYKEDDFEIQNKDDNSPLTKADLAANNVITKFLLETNIPILSEEGKSIEYSTRKNWNQLWIVDPIDGTKEFIKRNGEFTVNIALIENQKPVLGVVYAPAIDTLYFSSREQGAFKVKISKESSAVEIFQKAMPLPISAIGRKYTVVASRSHLSEETLDYIENLKSEHGEMEFISIGSSLKLCLVAEGKADCYPRFAPTMEWDTAAGQAICEHAGCKVIDQGTGKAMLYNREELLNNWFIVTK